MTRYDRIGHGYSATRREDARFYRLIEAALGGARSVVNVGAGAGSYEPRDRAVLAVEPSAVMVAQRPRGRAPALRAWAHALPFRDHSFDAAMSVLSVHHWDAGQEAGVRELRRVALGPVVLLTCDPAVTGALWFADYLPENADLDRRIFPSSQRLAGWLGGVTRTQVVPVPRDTCDWSLMACWAHPERLLDAAARAAISGCARMSPAATQRLVVALSRDLADGSWDARHGHLRGLDALDAGLRLVVGLPG